jgi:hypothetical protein
MAQAARRRESQTQRGQPTDGPSRRSTSRRRRPTRPGRGPESGSAARGCHRHGPRPTESWSARTGSGSPGAAGHAVSGSRRWSTSTATGYAGRGLHAGARAVCAPGEALDIDRAPAAARCAPPGGPPPRLPQRPAQAGSIRRQGDRRDGIGLVVCVDADAAIVANPRQIGGHHCLGGGSDHHTRSSRIGSSRSDWLSIVTPSPANRCASIRPYCLSRAGRPRGWRSHGAQATAAPVVPHVR